MVRSTAFMRSVLSLLFVLVALVVLPVLPAYSQQDDGPARDEAAWQEVITGQIEALRRSDGAEVAFTVYRVDRYPKSDFPSDAVYGNTPGAELRLITCGGAFDALTGHYRDNVVAYARRV